MFNIEEYKKFIRDNLTNIIRNKNVIDRIEKYIDALCQFEVRPQDYLNVSDTNYSITVRKNFNIKNKPRSVSVNTYLLFLFGYIHCNKCKEIKVLKLYNTNNNSWNKKVNRCISCDKNYIQENYESVNKSKKLWRENNKYKLAAKEAKRRATKLQATPKWLTKQNWIDIRNIYLCCSEYNRLLTEQYQVDHIVPLKGKNVCGLHVPWNLQVITAKENLNKSNKINN